MATQMNLNNGTTTVEDGKDSIVIVKALTDLPAGAVLNVEGFDANVIRAGHIVVRDNTSKDLKPLAVSGSAYQPIGSDKFVGVLRASITKDKPIAAIVTAGQVNGKASPYPITQEIVKGLPKIEFLYVDPEA